MPPTLLIGGEQEIVVERGRYPILNEAVILAISETPHWHHPLRLLIDGAL